MNEKFKKLSEKIAHISTKSKDQPNKANKLEIKVENLEGIYKSSVETFEMKFAILKEHIMKLKCTLEDEKNSKDDLKKIYFSELREMQSRVRCQIDEERDHMKINVENVFKKLESTILSIEKKSKLKNDEIKKSIFKLREQVEADMPDLKVKLENENLQRESTFDNLIQEMNFQFNRTNEIIDEEYKKSDKSYEGFSNSLSKVMCKVRDEFTEEKKQRENFEENILTLLKDTTENLSKFK
jgi:hypothetical protein